MAKEKNWQKFRILVTAAKGIAPYTAEEMRSLGFPILSEEATGVFTEGNWMDCLKLNLFLRSGQRVLCHLKTFNAKNADDFYNKLVTIPWENYLRQERHFAVRTNVNNPQIRDTRFAALKCKDAIVDRFREKTGRRPDSGKFEDEGVVYVFWQGNDCAVYLDSSGTPLYKRGYRLEGGKAPMQETLAAAIVSASQWDQKSVFVNPMCGSGTLAIEAAMMAAKIAPGFNRKNWAFLHYKDVPIREMRKELNHIKEITNKTDAKIIASDINHRAVSMAKENARRAGVSDLIEFQVCRFEETVIPQGPGVVMLNPGYGHRIGKEENLVMDYRQIGDFFKQNCKGKTGAIFTGNPRLGKEVHLKTKAKIPFYNGKIDSRLLLYDLF